MQKNLFCLFGVVLVSLFVVLHANKAQAADKEITIRYATFFGQEYPEHWAAMMKFIEIINQKGKGKVKVEFYPSETLLKAKELFSGLMSGAAEAVTVPMVYWHGNLPISQGLSLPFAFDGDMEKYNRAIAPGSPIVNFLNEQFAQKNIFCFFAIIECHEYLWTRKAVKSPEDLKGMKIRTSGLIPSEVLNRLSAGPVSMPSGEIYTALQRGTVDGLLGSYTTVVGRSLQETVGYGVTYPYFGNFGPMVIAFKKDYWEKLPKDIQDIIREAGVAYYETEFSVSKQITGEQVETLRKSIEFVKLTPEAQENFNKLLLPMYDWWISRKEIGDSGKKLIELMQAAK